VDIISSDQRPTNESSDLKIRYEHDMSKPIKVLHYGGNTRINGISAFIMGVYRKLDPNKYQFHIVNTGRGNGYYIEEIRRLGGYVHKAYTERKGLMRLAFQMRSIKEIIKTHGPFDVVHAHYFSTNGYILHAARSAHVPIRISHCHQSNPRFLSLAQRLELWTSRWLTEKVATHKLGCSKVACDFLYGDKSSEVLYSGIDLNEFDISQKSRESILNKYKLNDKDKHIVFVGRFERQKNPLFVLDVFAELCSNMDGLRLIMTGNGRLLNDIKVRSENLGIQERVLLVQNCVEVADILTIADVMMLPSLWEGFGIVLIEAQAMGVRCLVSDLCPIEADIGLCEFLPLEQREWVERLVDVLSTTPVRKPYIDARFDNRTTTERILRYYNGVVDQKDQAK